MDKGVDALDWTVWNAYDALPFGDYDGKIKYELIRVDRWGKKDGFFGTTFNKEHPENVVKTPISLVADYYLFDLIFNSIFGHGGSSGSSNNGAVILTEPGRKGGEAILRGAGGAGVK